MRYTRRARSAIGAGAAVVLMPLVLTTASPTAPAAQVGPRARPPADSLYFALASRSGARAAVLEQVEPATVIEAAPDGSKRREVAVSSPKGTRVWTVSALSDHGLPMAAEKAYRRAAAQMAQVDPGCQLPWTLLAGIGRVESDHGRYGGSRLGADGVSRPRMIGVALDGAGPVAAIRDTDDGQLDGDKVWDRAVGPMQFIPETWSSAARDGDGDGRMSPHNLDDAAAAAASYLCSGSGSLLDSGAQAAAIYRYNQDDYYVALVQAFEVGYRTGVFVIPSPPVDEEPKAHHKKRRHKKHAGPTGQQPKKGGGKKGSANNDSEDAAKPPADSPSPKPSPSPSPKPGPAPKPEPPQPTTVEDVLTVADGVYYLGGKQLDLGIVGQLGATAVGDFDGDGTVETNGNELAGMVDTKVTMVVVELDGGKLGIYSINGISLG